MKGGSDLATRTYVIDTLWNERERHHQVWRLIAVRMVTRTAVVAGALTCLTIQGEKLARAQQNCPPVDPDPTRVILEHAKRIQTYVGLISEKNQVSVRAAALAQALKEGDPAIRSLAIREFLRRFNALTPEVENDPSSGASVAAEDVPRMAVRQVEWSDDASSFTSYYSTTCGYNPRTSGQVAGGKLVLNYDGLCVRSSLLGKSEGKQAKGDPLVLAACQLTMTPNDAGNMLLGPLHCVGMPTVMTVRLPFGP